jgi:DNA-binding transcriptional ArsR family regulator
MELDLLFRALSDPTRRRLMDELAERDGQTLFELHVRMINWHGASLSRQALSKHLATLEEAGLLRTEWRWRSKHHFLEREPIRRAWKLWLGGFVHPKRIKKETPHEDRADERAGG